MTRSRFTQTLARWIFAPLGLSLMMACSHATKIITVPPGAKVKIDGKVVGKSPAIYQERSGIPFRKRKIEVSLNGYGSLTRYEKVRICPTAGNLVMDSLIFGWFIGFCLSDSYVYDFTKPKSKKDARRKIKKKKESIRGERAPVKRRVRPKKLKPKPQT